MTDYSKMSDAELLALAGPKAAPDYSKMSDDELLAAAQGPSVAADVAKSGGIGLAKGGIGLAGFAGDAQKLLQKGADWVSSKLPEIPETKLGKFLREESAKTIAANPRLANSGDMMGGGNIELPTAHDIQGSVEKVTGEFYKPKTRAGKYAETVGEFLPASMLGPGGTAIKAATGVTAGLASEGAGQLTEGTKAEPYSRVVGALLGGVAPMAAARAVTPLPATAARQRLVDILGDEGVTSLTAGQRTGNKSLQYSEDMLGNAPGAGSGATNIRQRGQEQFTEAAMRRAGAGPDATPEVLAANNQRLGQEFRDLSARNDLMPDNQFVTDIVAAARNYRRVPDSQQRQMVQGYIDDIVGHVNAGQMPGPFYQEMRSRLSRESKSLRQSDPTLSEALRDMRNALDNAMERSIAGSPDAGAWGQARREWGAQKTIEKTASRAGEATAEGQLVPANLRNTVSAENRGAYARGEGQFSELARAGAGVMAPLPNSGTAQRLNATNIAMLPVTATIGRALMSRPVQGYLGNQAIADAIRDLPPARQAMVKALLSEQGVAQLEGPRQ